VSPAKGIEVVVSHHSEYLHLFCTCIIT
jgi:hypothetical protein